MISYRPPPSLTVSHRPLLQRLPEILYKLFRVLDPNRYTDEAVRDPDLIAFLRALDVNYTIQEPTLP